MASQLFEQFNFDNPVDWFTRMEAAHSLLESSSGSSVDKKTYLLATIGSKASILIADLLAPLSISDASITYSDIKATLTSHLKDQHLEIAERCNFYSANQTSRETSSQFYSRLKKLSEHCNFGSSLNSMLRDRMVLGCRSLEARKRLLQEEPLTLQKVKDTLAMFEAIEIAKNGALAETSSADINFSKKPKAKPSTPQNKPRTCFRCGRQTCKSTSTCPARGKTCSNCGKQNHFRSVCRSKTTTKQFQLNHSDSVDVMHLDTIPTHNAESRITLRINDSICIMEVDTGASATIISAKMWRTMGSPTLNVSNRLFTAYDGHRMKPLGDLINCRIESSDVSILSSVTVVESQKSYGLLGRDIMDNFIAKPIVSTNKIDCSYLPTMKTQPVSIDVSDPSRLRFCKARPVPLPMKEQIDAELSRLQDRGIIKPVSSSKYASPVVWIKKRDGTLRMCADFKVHVNRSIQNDSYPMPAMETIFAGLSDAKHFAKIDLKEAYWQIPLDAKSREICTINTSKGLFHMTRLPKGMKNSSAIFQRVIESILKDVQGVIIYQDDILIHASSSDSLARRVSSVIQRLEEKNVTVNKAKSILNTSQVKFLGHVLTETGIRPDPDIAAKIQSFKPPTNRSQLESFLGLTNFFGRMIPNYSKIVQPLHYLRRKDVDFQWTQEHTKAFDEILRIMASSPVLASYDLNKPTTLTTDASEKAIGGVLTQNDKPVIFVSRVLTKSEQRYSNIEKEALAVVWSILRLKQLLLGRHFSLITDHKPLVQIYGGPRLPKVASNRLTRWSILLQRFNFTIEHKPGSEITHADALTRLQLRSDESDEEDLVINNVEANMSDEWNLSLQEASKHDDLAQSIIHRVHSGNWKNLKTQEKCFFRLRGQLAVHDDLLFMSNKCYIPPLLRRDVFNDSHKLHTGIHSTVNLIKLNSWWPTLTSDVREWVRNCSTCSKLRPSSSKHLKPWPVNNIFERIHADWCHIPEVGDILIVVDSASGWIEASLPQARTTQNVIGTLTSIFARFGIPKILVTDNAAEFTSKELNDFCRSNGITKMESPPYHAQSNGVAERGVQTVKNGMKAWKLDNSHMTFNNYLKRLLLHHRACFQRADGKTPAEIVYGRKIRVPLTRNFFFSESISYKGRDGVLRDGTFLMERGSNTAWLLDASNNRLRLAHDSQISRHPLASTPSSLQPRSQPFRSPATDEEEKTLPMFESPVSSPTAIRERGPTESEPEPTTSQQPRRSTRGPTEPDPESTAPQPTRRSSRRRIKKSVTDYEDL